MRYLKESKEKFGGDLQLTANIVFCIRAQVKKHSSNTKRCISIKGIELRLPENASKM